MKKIIICLLAAIMLMNCEIRVKQTNAQDTKHHQFEIKIANGMQYGIWSSYNSGDGNRSIFVVNLTKDSLEVELLRKQLNK